MRTSTTLLTHCISAETLSELGAFRARHAAAAAKNASLKASIPEVDLARYKSILKDQRAVEQAQKVLSEFKPVSYDVAKFTSAIDAFEGRAVSIEIGSSAAITY